jgi:SAM-dependent methyltransferase
LEDLDSPLRYSQIRATIKSKPALYRLYVEYYLKFKHVIESSPASGKILELGSGAGFIKEIVPEVETSDVIHYEGVDAVVDATKMPFQNQSVKAIFLLLVFHHIPDVAAFLNEATRCLAPGGRILIIDQHHGWISRWILKHAHHEPYDPEATTWTFKSKGPLTSANGALSWIVFQRDYATFKAKFPDLERVYYRPTTPLRYWLSGGLKRWTLLPNFMFPFFSFLDKVLCLIAPNLGSFVEIELRRK